MTCNTVSTATAYNRFFRINLFLIWGRNASCWQPFWILDCWTSASSSRLATSEAKSSRLSICQILWIHKSGLSLIPTKFSYMHCTWKKKQLYNIILQRILLCLVVLQSIVDTNFGSHVNTKSNSRKSRWNELSMGIAST